MKTQKKYNLYKHFLKSYKDFYNIFFLADLMHWVGEEKFFSREEIKGKWVKETKSAGSKVNFYIHVPFCKSRCNYCMYHSRKSSPQRLESFIDETINKMEYFEDVFRETTFNSLYLGGGTPSILSKKQMDRLLSPLFSKFDFKNEGEKAIECNPQSINSKKLKVLNEFGFNRVSFGVQNLNKDVLDRANRGYQDYDLVKRTIEKAKEFNFEVNTDLMIGIKGDDVESIIYSFNQLAKIGPDSFTLYPFKPPKEYLKKNFDNDYVSFNKDLRKKVKIVRQRLEEDNNGYELKPRRHEIFTSTEPMFMREDYDFNYEGEYDYNSFLNFLEPCSLFSLGTGSSSYIFNSLQYHEPPNPPSGKNLSNHYWGMDLSLKDEMRHFILQNLSGKWGFSSNDFENYFGEKFKDFFSEEIKSLEEINKIKFEGEFTFLPKKPIDRYAASLFLFEEERVMATINKFFNK